MIPASNEIAAASIQDAARAEMISHFVGF